MTEYHYKKLKSVQGSQRDGQKEGEWLYWNTDGTLQKKETWHQGKLEGPYMEYLVVKPAQPIDLTNESVYKNSLALQKEGREPLALLTGYYQHGLKNGKWITSNKQAVIVLQENFVNDTLEGEKTENLYPSELSRRISHYHKGVLQASEEYPAIDNTFLFEQDTYHVDTLFMKADLIDINTPVTRKHYLDGVLHGVYFHQDKNQRTEGEYIKGQKSGTWNITRTESSSRYQYKNGILQGDFISWKWGNTDSIGHYENGLLQGDLTVYSYDSDLTRKNTTHYDKGEKNGASKYYEREILAYDYTYAHDHLYGLQHTWYTNGKMKMETLWRDGRDSVSTLYYETGQVSSREWYRGGGELWKKTDYAPSGKMILKAEKRKDGSFTCTNYEGQPKTSIVNADEVERPEEMGLVRMKTPDYPVSISSLEKFMNKNLRVPLDLQREGMPVKVMVTFKVDTDGILQNVETAAGTRQDLDQEIKRVLHERESGLSGRIGYTTAICIVTMPVIFK